jgi:hypothetical protein
MPGCGHAAHDDIDGAAYSYVLGLYLGDGHLATFPRTRCLRIYLDARYPEIVRAGAGAVGRAPSAQSCAGPPQRGMRDRPVLLAAMDVPPAAA